MKAEAISIPELNSPQSVVGDPPLTPYQLAQRVYATEPCARSLEEDIALHLAHGYVVARPDALAMARPVWKHWPYEKLASPWIVAPEGDAWWIWLLAGDLKTAMTWLPDAHRPWIGYERVNVPRWVRRERLVRGGF